LDYIFIFGGGGRGLRSVRKLCQCQICHKRRKKECLGEFKFSLN
jgi:acetyl/propionyl-CoA carboxylase alpha subunit